MSIPRLLLQHSFGLRAQLVSPITWVCSSLASPWARQLSSQTKAAIEEITAKQLCLVTVKDGIKRIVLDHSAKRNALSFKMLSELLECISAPADDVRVIIISANGPVFSSGHDLKELRTSAQIADQAAVFRTCSLLMLAIEKSKVPVMAQVNGLAAAAGCQLIAACDIVVASVKSKFSTPGVNNGLFCSTPGIPLVRAVPKKVAAKMLFTGDAMSAQEALQAGLISAVVEEEQLEDETIRIATRICDKSSAVIALGKEFLNFQSKLTDSAEAYMEGEKVMLKNLGLDDCQEGLTAFFEKRKPSWR